jgi:hypothetical protein
MDNRKRKTLLLLLAASMSSTDRQTPSCSSQYSSIQVAVSSNFDFKQFQYTLIAQSKLSMCNEQFFDGQINYIFGPQQANPFYLDGLGDCPICGLFNGEHNECANLYWSSSRVSSSDSMQESYYMWLFPQIRSLLDDLRNQRMNNGLLYCYSMSLTLITDFALVNFTQQTADFVDYINSTQLKLYLIVNNAKLYEHFPDYWQKSVISMNVSETSNYDICNRNIELGRCFESYCPHFELVIKVHLHHMEMI